jgi:crotonobetainyl-CoA:carnitine CoA-transferase CaiB-like acyl-CoA transferase
MEAFEARRLPCATYRGIGDLDGDPQLVHRGMLTEVNDAAGPLKVPNSPFLFSDTHAVVGAAVARIGEHNYDVLSDHLGMTTEEIAALEKSGVIGPAP